ncbi:MAG TPA: phosphotransferase [Longimicrobiaceae bacterium]|nr:phosphotransferase [Longimicrobiaceae bacterium]
MSTPEPPRGLAVPVLKSLLSAEGLAEVVAREYGLEEVRCELLKAVTLDTYRVRSRTGSFALRVYPAQRSAAAEVRGELEFLARLDAAGVPVPVAVPRADGGLLLVLEAPEGARLAVLFGFAPGQALGDRLTPESLRAYGALLARLHQAADAMPPLPGRPALTVEALVDRPLDELVRAYGTRSSAAAVGRHAAAAVRPVIAALPQDPPVYGLCHGEPGTNNVLTTADGRLTLLDFEFCGPGWRAHDLAVAVNDLPAAGARDFLEGYRDVRTLTGEELEAIPHFQAAHYLWVLAMRARHLNEWGAYLFPEPLVVQTFAKIEALVEGR